MAAAFSSKTKDLNACFPREPKKTTCCIEDTCMLHFQHRSFQQGRGEGCNRVHMHELAITVELPLSACVL